MTVMSRIALKITILAVLTGFSLGARAEYYLEYPEPEITQLIEYTSPHYHQKMSKRHAAVHKVTKKRSHVDITVTYYWSVCPGCVCNSRTGNCYPNDEQLNRKAVMGSYVGFSYKNVDFRDMKAERSKDMEYYDMRTVDDDVMHYPDMNNQYQL